MFGMIYIIIGLAMLFVGGEALVRGAVALAVKLDIPKIVIGLTIVALGTSAPEIMVCVQSALKNHPDIAIGNIIGSNIANILLVLGFSTLICPVVVGKDTRTLDAPFLLFVTLLCAVFCFFNGFSWREGALFLIILAANFSSLFFMARNEASPDEAAADVPEDADMEVFKMIFALVIGIVLLAAGSEILVNGAVLIAHSFGISEAVIGATIVAIGSSSPEIITCVLAARRNQADFILGNIIGSNVLNILAGIGLASTLTWLAVAKTFLVFDVWFMVAVTLVFWWIIKTKPYFGKHHAMWFLLAYAVFIIKQVVVA